MVDQPYALPDLADDAATRYLSHAVYTDEALLEYVLTTVIKSPHRRRCPAFGIDLVAVGRHAAVSAKRRKVQAAAFLAIRVATLPLIAVALITGPVLAGLAVALAAPVAAWGFLFWRIRADRASALGAITDPRASRELAPPLPQDIEDRLEKLGDTNVIIYARGQGDPFVGSGTRLHQFQLRPLDITRPSPGSAAGIRPFTNVDLHQYLAQHVPAHGFTKLHARNRLYVRGDHLDSMPWLLPDKYGAPEAAAPSDAVRAGAADPSQYARTYISMENVLRGGNLVISMYARARLHNGLLSVERLLYFLPPVHPSFQPTRQLIADTPARATWHALLLASRRSFPLLIARDKSHARTTSVFKELRRAQARSRREIKRGMRHDYGAVTSLREAVATYDSKEHFDEADVIDNAMTLGKRLMDCIEKFLQDHGVDTSDFDHQMKNMTNITQIGTIQAGNAVVGGQGHIISGHGVVNNASSQASNTQQPPGSTNPGQP